MPIDQNRDSEPDGGWRGLLRRWAIAVAVTCGPLWAIGASWFIIAAVFVLEVLALVVLVFDIRASDTWSPRRLSKIRRLYDDYFVDPPVLEPHEIREDLKQCGIGRAARTYLYWSLFLWPGLLTPCDFTNKSLLVWWSFMLFIIYLLAETFVEPRVCLFAVGLIAANALVAWCYLEYAEWRLEEGV